MFTTSDWEGETTVAPTGPSDASRGSTGARVVQAKRSIARALEVRGFPPGTLNRPWNQGGAQGNQEMWGKGLNLEREWLMLRRKLRIQPRRYQAHSLPERHGRLERFPSSLAPDRDGAAACRVDGLLAPWGRGATRALADTADIKQSAW